MLFYNFRISLCGRSHGSRRRTEWMTVTAMLETAEAGKSGDIKVPHVAVAVFCELGTWADTPRSESSQLHRRCCQRCDGHCVTGNVYSSSCCLVSSCEQHENPEVGAWPILIFVGMWDRFWAETEALIHWMKIHYQIYLYSNYQIETSHSARDLS